MNTFMIMRIIGDAPSSLLNSTETAILMRIALISDKSGKGANPGIKKLIETTKFCRRVILKSLKSLTDKKILIERSGRISGSNIKSEYEINIESLINKNINYHTKLDVLASAPGAPAASARGALEEEEKNTSLVHQMHQASAPDAPAASARGAPPPYTPNILEPIQPRSSVHLDENFQLDFCEEKLSDEKKLLESKINEVFRHWQNILNHKRSVLNESRRKKISEALQSGFSVESLKLAIEGVKKSPFHMGDNKRREVYDDIDLIFRNPRLIDKFIRYFDTEPRVEKENVSTAKKSAFWENQKTMGEVLDFYDPLKESNLTYKEDKANELK